MRSHLSFNDIQLIEGNSILVQNYLFMAATF